jgi:hypothetical protein
MKRAVLLLSMLGCSSHAAPEIAEVGGDTSVSFTDADLACPESEPSAGDTCTAERSCTYRCGCGWLSTATCRGGVWKTTFCPPPEQICRDGGDG